MDISYIHMDTVIHGRDRMISGRRRLGQKRWKNVIQNVKQLVVNPVARVFWAYTIKRWDPISYAFLKMNTIRTLTHVKGKVFKS